MIVCNKSGSLVALVLTFTIAASAQAAPAPATTSPEQLARDFLAPREAPAFARKFALPEALRFQRSFVKQLEPALGKPVGYKVGLVTREAQERYGVDAPIRGVLLEKMLL